MDKTIYNEGVELQEVQTTGPIISTDSDVTARTKLLIRQGEVLFEQIATPLNRLQPGRALTEGEFQQVCLALALFIYHLLDSEGDEP